MADEDEIKAQFAEDILKHELTIHHDDGVYRHLVLKNPETSNQWFELVTWPGSLAFGGGMGTYVFSRIHDMFRFFRSHPGEQRINPWYWSQKLEAGRDAQSEFSQRNVAEQVEEYLQEWCDDLGDDEDAINSLRDEVDRYLDYKNWTHEEEARQALGDFSYDGHEFGDVWEWSMREHSGRFLWCCHAIVWGIAQYDAMREQEEKVNDGATAVVPA